jgi:hypothetical protein
MPYEDPDPEDPNVLVGVELPADPESTRQMAWAFAEEFAALGFDEERLLALFAQPFYAGAHQAFQILGPEEIRAIVSESLSVWGHYRVAVKDAVEQPEDHGGGLIQIQSRKETSCPK